MTISFDEWMRRHENGFYEDLPPKGCNSFNGQYLHDAASAVTMLKKTNDEDDS